MKILVFPRKWFADRKGTGEEVEIFDRWNIISLITPAYLRKNFEEETVPFSERYAKRDNVLVLKFHDADRQWDNDIVLMNDEDAGKIYDFVQRTMDNGKNGYLVHCTAGKSRSQAVGYVLNEYFNGRHGIFPDEVEYNEYEGQYEKSRTMNALVKRLMMDRFFGAKGE